MKLYLKQKVFSWVDRFTVYDEQGREKYYVEGQLISFGKKLHVLSPSGDELAFISQKFPSFLPRYRVFVGEKEVAEIACRMSFLKQRYTVSTGWEITGDFFAHEYTVTDGALPIATVSKAWFTWGDAYSIDIAPYASELEMLAVVLAIDATIADN